MKTDAVAVLPDVTTKEGLRRYAYYEPPRPPAKPTKASWRRMTAASKEAFEEERLTYLNSWIPLETPSLGEAFGSVSLTLRANRYLQPGIPRPGAILDSDAGGLGKTTILLELARRWAKREWARCPSGRTSAGHEFIPVVYVTLDANTTVKSLNSLFAHFLNIPLAARSRNENTAVVAKVLRACAASLILIDDISFLKMNRIPDRLVCDHLKRLASTVPATFVCAGINCLNTGLLWEGLSEHDQGWSQTAGRFVRLRVEPFSDAQGDLRDEWIALLMSLEEELVLMDSFQGMLAKRLWRYLYDRTHGEIGALMHLIRQGALLAILRGTECLNEGLLDEIVLPHLHEAKSAAKGTRKRPSRKPRRRNQRQGHQPQASRA